MLRGYYRSGSWGGAWPLELNPLCGSGVPQGQLSPGAREAEADSGPLRAEEEVGELLGGERRGDLGSSRASGFGEAGRGAPSERAVGLKTQRLGAAAGVADVAAGVRSQRQTGKPKGTLLRLDCAPWTEMEGATEGVCSGCSPDGCGQPGGVWGRGRRTEGEDPDWGTNCPGPPCLTPVWESERGASHLRPRPGVTSPPPLAGQGPGWGTVAFHHQGLLCGPCDPYRLSRAAGPRSPPPAARHPFGTHEQHLCTIRA